MLTAKKKIRHEISELNERLKQSKEAIVKMKQEIDQLDTVDIKPKILEPVVVETVPIP